MSDGRRKGPKVEELAAELGVKPRGLLAIAAELGIAAQNRATRIAPADVRRIRAHLAQPAQSANHDETP